MLPSEHRLYDFVNAKGTRDNHPPPPDGDLPFIDWWKKVTGLNPVKCFRSGCPQRTELQGAHVHNLEGCGPDSRHPMYIIPLCARCQQLDEKQTTEPILRKAYADIRDQHCTCGEQESEDQITGQKHSRSGVDEDEKARVTQKRKFE